MGRMQHHNRGVASHKRLGEFDVYRYASVAVVEHVI